MRLSENEIVDVELVIVLGVRNCRLQALADILGNALARKLKIGERGRDLLAADQARDKIEFLRAHPEHPGDRLSLILGEAALVRFLAHRFSVLNLARCRGSRGRRARAALGLAVRRMAIKGARRGELAELMADHLFAHLHRNVLVAVVNAEHQPDELRQDRRAAGPDSDHLVPGRWARGFCLLEQIAVDERTFPNRTRHGAWPLLLLAYVAARHDEFLGALVAARLFT